jgi:hypothetical protein
VEVRAKFDVFATLLNDSTWVDARDRLLLESLRNGVLRLLPRLISRQKSATERSRPSCRTTGGFQ